MTRLQGILFLFLLFNYQQLFSQRTSLPVAAESLEYHLDHLDNNPRYKQIDLLDKLRPYLLAAIENPQQRFGIPVNKIKKAIALSYRNKGEFNHAIPVLKDILQTGTVLKDSLEVLGFLRQSYVALNDLTKAYEVQLMLDRLRLRHPEISWAYIPRLSSLYYHFNMFSEAIRETKKEIIELKKDTLDEYFLANYSNDLGLFYSRLGNVDSALFYYRRAEELLSKTNIDKIQKGFFEGLIKGNIAQAIMQRGEYKEAIPLLIEDIKNSYRSGNSDNAAVSHNELATCYIKTGMTALALRHLDSADLVLKLAEFPKVLLVTKKLRVQAFTVLNDVPLLLKAYKDLQEFEDSLARSDQSRLKNSQQVIHELDLMEQQRREQEELMREQLISKERYDQKQTILLVILTMSSLLVGILIFYSLKGRDKRRELSRQNRRISEQNQLIELSLKEKTLLLQEIHHRVKNNLQIISSLLRLQQEKIHNKDAQETINQSKRRIESMALVHQLLYQGTSFNEIKMNEYLETLLSKLTFLLDDPTDNFDVKLDSDPITLHIDKAIPLGLIINEIVTNTFKHGTPEEGRGILEISLKKENEKITFVAKDNGKGFPQDVEERKKNSLGLELIEILSGQLDAELLVVNNNGVNYRITLKHR